MTSTPVWWTKPRTGPEMVDVALDAQIAASAVLDGAHGPITIASRTVVHPGALLLPYGGSIRIGEDCSVNPYTVLYGHGGLRIGNGVRIATHCVVIPANHRFDDPEIPIRSQGESRLGVTIGDDVWIGAHVTVLDGVEVGSSSVIAAGAVVSRDVPAGSVVAGVPAKVVRSR